MIRYMPCALPSSRIFHACEQSRCPGSDSACYVSFFWKHVMYDIFLFATALNVDRGYVWTHGLEAFGFLDSYYDMVNSIFSFFWKLCPSDLQLSHWTFCNLSWLPLSTLSHRTGNFCRTLPMFLSCLFDLSTDIISSLPRKCSIVRWRWALVHNH